MASKCHAAVQRTVDSLAKRIPCPITRLQTCSLQLRSQCSTQRVLQRHAKPVKALAQASSASDVLFRQQLMASTRMPKQIFSAKEFEATLQVGKRASNQELTSHLTFVASSCLQYVPMQQSSQQASAGWDQRPCLARQYSALGRPTGLDALQEVATRHDAACMTQQSLSSK
jgi:hypothetical protein